MRRREVTDCERDVKGIHDWEDVDQNTLWCRACGAIGRPGKWRQTKHSPHVTIIRRVKEG